MKWRQQKNAGIVVSRLWQQRRTPILKGKRVIVVGECDGVLPKVIFMDTVAFDGPMDCYVL
tara:strand:- start:43 stop:225 length:183 start_codon:yes stop_codon:yes gene_type:complete